MDDDDVIALIGLALVLHKRKRKRDRAEKRNHFSHVNLINELKFTPTDYKNYLRMDEKLYLKLLSLITPLIQRQDTVMREAISAHERLAVTLRFLATGRTECLKYSAVISPQALGQIIPETCDAIYKALKEDYLQFPDSTDKWKEIAQLFEERWNFPHCLGAIDGKHIDIVQPADSGCQYYNHKGRYSMVLMAIVDANYRFLLVDFGTNGRVCDAGVLQNTRFFRNLQMQHLNLPNSEPIQHSSRCLPYVFVADDALPLRPDMLKPYRQTNLNSHEKKIFNYRLSRARRTVENAFGILASRFRIYHTQINLEPNNIQKLVMATCALHNFLIEHTPDSYAPPRCFYRENVDNETVVSTDYNTARSNVEDLQGENRGNVLNDAKKVRIEYQTYFVNEGKVPWQDSFIEM